MLPKAKVALNLPVMLRGASGQARARRRLPRVILVDLFPAPTCEKLEVKRVSWCHLEGESKHLRRKQEKLEQSTSFSSGAQVGWWR